MQLRDLDGGAKNFQQKILRAGAQTKIFDGKFLVAGKSLPAGRQAAISINKIKKTPAWEFFYYYFKQKH